MQATGSISRGTTAEKHNTRECYRDEEHTPENIDRSRTPENVTLVNRSLEEVYQERFGEALEAYNAQQVAKRHPERQIPDYLAKVREDKKLQPMYEFVVQVGNKDEHPDADTAKAIYSDWLDGFRARFGAQFAVKQAIVHMDEATAHMHVEVVPCAESKRGLAVQNSMNKAVKQAGFEDYKAMLAGWDEVLTECMAKHGVERIAGDREKQMGGVDIETYKRSMAVQKATEEATERLECLQQEEGRVAGELAELEAQAMEPAGETILESARTLFQTRGDGERESGLAEEIAGLRERIGVLESSNDRVRTRVVELERELPGLRERAARIGERLAAAQERVAEFLHGVRFIPDTLSAATQAVAHRLGIRVLDQFRYEVEEAKDVAQGMEAIRGWSQQQNRGLSR